MADDSRLEEAEFWLPSEFLTDEDILMDKKENFNKSNSVSLCFPTESPYDYWFFRNSSVLSSPVESVVGSAETESDEEDSLLTGLTRQLSLSEAHKLTPTNQHHEKSWVMSGSPQSTLTQVRSWSSCQSTGSSNGSPNGPSQVSSPPTTPLAAKNDAWDLIYQAAGQVARLKMNGGYGPTRNPGLLGPQRRLTPPPPPKNPSASTFYRSHWHQVKGEEMLKQEGCEMWSRQVKNGRTYEQEVLQNRSGNTMIGGPGSNSCAWPNLQVQQRNQQHHHGLNLSGGYGYGFGYGCGSGGIGGGEGPAIGVKRERSGTGVFLPRRYGNNNYNNISSGTTESRKKPGCSHAWLPTRPVPALNKNLSIRSIAELPRMNSELITDYEALVARRAQLLTQQRMCTEASIGHEIRLPQEWTY